jgi:hypothetical protein
MKRAAILLLALALAACGGVQRAELLAAHTVARVSNAAATAMAEAMRAEGNAAIDGATSAAEARAELEAVEARWRPVWTAHDRLADRHTELAEAIAAGELLHELEQAGAAYCELRAAALEATELELADLPIGGCP